MVGEGRRALAYHLLIAYGTGQAAAGTGGGSSMLAGPQQDLAANVFSRLGGAGGAVGRLAAQRQRALRGRQQARIADMGVLRLRCLERLRLCLRVRRALRRNLC